MITTLAEILLHAARKHAAFKSMKDYTGSRENVAGITALSRSRSAIRDVDEFLEPSSRCIGAPLLQR
jgi:hypothetical protein